MSGRLSNKAAWLELECAQRGVASCWAADLGAHLFEDSRDALAIVDAWGRVVSTNRECRLLFEDVHELEPGMAMLGGNAAAASPLADVVRLAYSERLQRNEFVQFRHRHGFELRLDVRVSPLRRSDGHIGGWLVRARLA